jgi:hypothetical protein
MSRVGLVCWKCGASLTAVPLPLSRQAECPACRAWLHACRLCEFYDPRLTGKCREERAEEVRDRETANFCDYFKPRPHAYIAARPGKADTAKAGLTALFGAGEGATTNESPPQQALDDLFKKDPES